MGMSDDRKPEEEELVQEREDDEELFRMASKKKAMSGIQEAKGVGIVLLLPVGVFGVIWAISAYEDVWPAGAICFVTSLLFVLLVGSSLRTSYGAGSSGNSTTGSSSGCGSCGGSGCGGGGCGGGCGG